ncbi:carbohydrate ABC transporter permease [Clostridium sp. C105KSO13]|uniref:carbohydrate ABC transporter permease n=1 Tax=Clostridium sp. C105KSO13 TaxID=1776045 RepID=UPI0007407FD0|nr:sugar ABC transporter permease [Clostridium sp. C105KSO13]CUX38642.1 sn-glycerol-3-phosphate transport system permease protein UgpA [Clostridium sp. C105KSO13]
MNNKLKNKLSPYMFILPCALLIIVILIYPVLTGLFKSFYNENLIKITQKDFVGLENYINLFHDKMFLKALRKSIVWTLAILVFEMLLGMFFAVILNKDIYCKKIFRCLVLIPWIIPNAIAGIIWKWFLNESYGMMNYILKSIGLIDYNLPWLSENKLAELSVIMVIIWKSIPFVAITLLAGMQAISVDLYEAAKVDGAKGAQCFRYITLPALKNISMITAILTSIWNFNQLEIIQVVTKGGPGEATMSLPIYIYRLFMQTFQTSYASAAAIIMMLILIVPCIFYVKKSLEG